MSLTDTHDKALILMYHRVCEVPLDPWSICVTPKHFSEQLEILQKIAVPMSLQRLTHAQMNGSIPRRSVVVTFDDGYADNFENAAPLLERYDVPATVFVATGCIGQEREFWWDELERLLLQSGALPEVLHLTVQSRRYEWRLGESAWYDEAAWERTRHWKAFEDVPTARHSLYYSIWQLLRPLAEGERRTILDKLVMWAGAEPVCRKTHRTLTVEEVVALAEGELVEVGSHTVTHSVLSSLPAAVQRDEIQRSKTRLEEILGRPVTSFAYPYGSQDHYTADTVAIVREAGFTSACCNFAGVVKHDTDPFQLPRVHVQDWDGDEFSRCLSLWFDS